MGGGKEGEGEKAGAQHTPPGSLSSRQLTHQIWAPASARSSPSSYAAYITHSLEESLFKGRLLPCQDNKPNQLFLTRLGEAGHTCFVAEICRELQNRLIPEHFVTHISTQQEFAFKM